MDRTVSFMGERDRLVRIASRILGDPVAFILHDTFGFEFSTITTLLDTTPAAARKLASRAHAKVGQPKGDDAAALLNLRAQPDLLAGIRRRLNSDSAPTRKDDK